MGKATGKNSNIEKVIAVYHELLKGNKVIREEIAEKYEISVRSVSRYMDYLSRVGVPIYSQPGKGGGYAIADDCLPHRYIFTKEEIRRIETALRATLGASDDEVTSSALKKTLSLVPKRNAEFSQICDTLIIDSATWTSGDRYRNRITLLKHAADRRKSVRMQYIDRHEYPSERLFDPYCVALKEGAWYVYGFCHTRQDFRLFKVSRITNLFNTQLTFEIRSGADAHAKLKGTFDTADLVEFVIEFSNLSLPDVEEWLGFERIYEHGTKYRARAKLYGGKNLTEKLLSLGSSVKIISPAVLREEILVECKRILAVNG